MKTEAGGFAEWPAGSQSGWIGRAVRVTIAGPTSLTLRVSVGRRGRAAWSWQTSVAGRASVWERNLAGTAGW